MASWTSANRSSATTTDEREHFVGRHVDVLGRALPVKPKADPTEAVRNWLGSSKNKTPRLLRTKGVVGLYPARYRGKIIWDPAVEQVRAPRRRVATDR